MIERILASSAPVLVGFSGGKDSIAMVLMLIKAGVPKHRIILHHHDVDGDGEDLFDWKCTKSYCIAFAKAFGLELLFSYRKGGIVREIFRNEEARQDVYYQREVDGPYYMVPSQKNRINTRLKFPAVAADLQTRWCSGTVKIEVFRTAVCNNPNYKVPEIFILTGERRQESANRAKYNEVEVHDVTRKKRVAVSWRAIIDWTEEQVWDIMREFGVVAHPCYFLNWSRCSCQTCIFNSPTIWANVNLISPQKTHRIFEIEQEIGFNLYHKQTIVEKFMNAKPNEMDPFWIEQATLEFTTPILVDTAHWQLPSGAFSMESSGSK